MKKILVAITLGISLLFCGSVLAQNIGDPMPSLEGTFVMGKDVKEKWVQKHLHDRNGCSHNVVYAVCGDEVMKNPVGIFVLGTRTLYLDNAPNDRIIDDIMTENFPGIPEIIPECDNS